MNAHELNQRLCDSIEAVLRHLFPAGKKVSGEWVVGSLAGEAGDSLKIRMGGMKKGYWCDFATNERGRSLLGLWAEVLRGDIKRACKEARQFLGIRDDYGHRFTRAPVAAAKPKPLDRSRVAKLDEAGPVYRYLVDERKIDSCILDVYKLGQTPNGDALVFPFFKVEDGEDGWKLGDKAEMVKFLKIERTDGKKDIWTDPAGATDSLFGKVEKVPVGFKKGILVITEGEIDALSVASFGYYAVSVPRGAKHATADGKSANDAWIAADFAWLADFERIFLWFDSDEPGRLAAKDVAKRIGLERCYIVETPNGLKDANELLCSGAGVEAAEKAFDSAQTLDPANLVWSSTFEEEVKLRLFPPGGVEPGFELPWAFPWKIRPGEMTVWTGFSGHGKTVCLSHLMVDLADKGQRVCIASMEVEPSKTLETTWCQSNGGRMPYSEAERMEWGDERALTEGQRRFHERYAWLHDRFLIFVPEVDGIGVGRADWRTLVDCFVYARQRFGCEQFVVDSMMMCVGRSEEDYKQVELFVNALSAFAKRHQVHVHLVAHSRKKEDEAKPPGKQDVAGPKETADIAHNCAVVHRNMAKHRKLQSLEREIVNARGQRLEDPEAIAERDAQIKAWEFERFQAKQLHDGELHLLKQRNGDGELASKYLFYLVNARQFVEASPHAAQPQTRSMARQYLRVETAMPTREELATK